MPNILCIYNKMNYIYILNGIILIIIFVYIYNISNNTNNNVKFLSKEIVVDFFNKDPDNYFKNMNEYDIYARNVDNIKEYINISKDSVLEDFTEYQKNLLKNITKKADNFLKDYDKNYLNIKWIFALVGNNYEDGLPHTRTNIIFLSPTIFNNDINILTGILIHEKVHIYQRYYPNEIQKYLSNNGYSFSRKKNTEKYIRSNPDLDDNIYINNRGKEMYAIYKSDKPTNINDVILTDYANEHPYEKMAYEIESEFHKKNI